MAPANRPSTLRVSVCPEADSFFVTGNPLALVTMAAADTTSNPTTNIPDSNSGKCLDSLVDNAQEACQTPKSEEQKIPPVLSCPPAPRKPKRIPVKRKIPANINHQHLRKKLRTGGLPKMSGKQGKGRSDEEYNVETNYLHGERHEQ